MAKVIKDSELEGKQIDFPTFVSIYEQFKKRPTIAAYADLMEAFKTYARQILSLNGADVPSTLQTELGDIVENLEKTKSLLLVRDRLWDEWTEDLQAALNDIDHRLGSAFVHFQSRQLEATADAAFFLLMHGFTTDDLAMQQQYLHMLDKVCPVA